MPRVAVLDDYHRRAGGYADWGSLGPDVEVVFFHEPLAQDQLLAQLADFDVLVQAFKAHGFRGPSALYTNDDANIAYARKALNGGRLSQPVLFVNGEWDAICSVTGNRQGDPMRAASAEKY